MSSHKAISILVLVVLLSISFAIYVGFLSGSQSREREIDLVLGSYAETLENVIVADQLLAKGDYESVLSAHKSLQDARAKSAILFTKENIDHKDIMFILFYNDGEVSKLPQLSNKNQRIINQYLWNMSHREPSVISRIKQKLGIW